EAHVRMRVRVAVDAGFAVAVPADRGRRAVVSIGSTLVVLGRRALLRVAAVTRFFALGIRLNDCLVRAPRVVELAGRGERIAIRSLEASAALTVDELVLAELDHVSMP